LIHKHCQNCNGNNEPYIPSQDEKNIDQTSSSLTALIIKWLEGREKHFIFCASRQKGKECDCSHYSRNQLTTELIGEVR